MIYFNMIICFTVLILGFGDVQNRVKTINCVNQLSFKLHTDNLKSLVKKSSWITMPSRCQRRVKYEVEIAGKVTNE